MKKILFGLAAMAGMLFATSCAKDAGIAEPSDNQTAVTFSVGLDHVLSSRAISDGKSADKLYYAAFNADNEPVEDGNTTINTATGKAEVTITLVKGKEYTVIFWAQNSQCGAYDVEDFPKVKVSYDGAKNNDETRDAFCGKVKITAGENASETVTLHRPFAQINFAGKDLKKPINQSAMKAKGVASWINLLTGDVDDQEATVDFAANAVPTEKLPNKDDYTWLSMSYVLVPADGTTLTLTFTFDGESTDEIPNIPAKVNYRTNLLASDDVVNAVFDVTIEPGYNTPDEDIQDVPGEGEEDEPTISVEDLKAEYNAATQSIDFSATYTGSAELTSAAFQYRLKAAAALARAEAEWSSVDVEDLSSNELKASAKVSEAGDYEYQVVINEEVAATGSDETPEVKVPPTTTPEPDPTAGTTPENPFTVAQAIEKAKETGKTATTESYYVKGKISSVKYTYNADKGTAQFEIIDEGVPTPTLTAYSVKYLNNASWVEGNDNVYVGDEVIVCGQIVNYNEITPEVTPGYLYEFVSKAHRDPILSNLKAVVEGTSVTFSVNFTNYSEDAITKVGFIYGDSNIDVAADIPSGTSGTITKKVDDLAYGSYMVKAYLNEVETTAIAFTIQDPGAEAETIVHTISWTAYGKNGGNSAYDKDCDMEIDGITWNLTGNAQINPWRIGGKSINSVDRTLYSKTPISENISQITVEHGTINLTVNSFKVIVAKDASFSDVVSELSADCKANSPATIMRPSDANWSNCYYKFVYNVTNTTSSNNYIQFNKAEFTGK